MSTPREYWFWLWCDLRDGVVLPWLIYGLVRVAVLTVLRPRALSSGWG